MPSMSSVLPNLCNHVIDSGRYRLLQPLGAGSYGVVYSARESIPDSNDTVIRAIKVCLREDPTSVRGLNQMREAVLHKKVSAHPNIVTLHRVISDGNYVYFVMDYCTGGDLLSQARKNRVFMRDEVLLKDVFLQILDGVEACHERKVFHRDLKPENIMVSQDLSEVYIADFGLATRSKTSIAFNTGSRHYMSPECIDCDDVLYPYDTSRCDIWALGITLLHLVAGRLPWQKATLEDPAFTKFLNEPEYLRTLFPLSSELNSVLRRVLTIVPKDAVTIVQLRRLVRNLDTFWMTDEEVAASNETVQHYHKVFRRKHITGNPLPIFLSSDSGPEEWHSCGDTLSSETSSESTNSLIDDSDDSDEREETGRGLARQLLRRVEETLARNPYPRRIFPSAAAIAARRTPASVPSPAPVMAADSSIEFPIREPGSRPACVPCKASSSGRTSSDSSGPNTPQTRPIDPPDVVIPEPLDASRSNPLVEARGKSGDSKTSEHRRRGLFKWSLGSN